MQTPMAFSSPEPSSQFEKMMMMLVGLIYGKQLQNFHNLWVCNYIINFIIIIVLFLELDFPLWQCDPD